MPHMLMADEIGGWVSPKDQKIIKQCRGGGWKNPEDKLGWAQEFFNEDYDGVVICSAHRFKNETQDWLNGGLPPLTSPHDEEIERIVNRVCVNNGKSKIQALDYVSQESLDSDFIIIECGLSEKEIQAIKTEEKQKIKLKRNKEVKAKIELLKKQCIDLGFNPGSKKLKSCVIELM